MGPFVILGAKERKSTWGDKKKMVNQFTDFEIFEEEYYDFADFLALELSDQRRKDRDNKKLRCLEDTGSRISSSNPVKKSASDGQNELKENELKKNSSKIPITSENVFP